MGARIKILLVTFGLLLLSSLAVDCQADITVKADNYSAFWLWAGVKPQPVLAQARTLYILQGQIDLVSENTVFSHQGVSAASLKQNELWLVFRAHTLQWQPHIYRALLGKIQQWQDAPNTITGIQIDFDTHTHYLHNYVSFLTELRTVLPKQYRLSITGLLDWSSNGDIESIKRLKNVVDEVVVQTYQGRKTIANYAAYLPRLDRLQMPYKIGLVQHGDWQSPIDFSQDPWFKGYVIFLLNSH